MGGKSKLSVHRFSLTFLILALPAPFVHNFTSLFKKQSRFDLVVWPVCPIKTNCPKSKNTIVLNSTHIKKNLPEFAIGHCSIYFHNPLSPYCLKATPQITTIVVLYNWDAGRIDDN